jgi:AI-2 transport protein TqsA
LGALVDILGARAMASETKARGLHWLLTAACLVVVVAGLRQAQALVVPLVISAFLAALSAPLVVWLHRRKVPPAVSVPLVVLIVVAMLLCFAGLLVGTGKAFVAAFPRYQARLDELSGGAIAWLRSCGVELNWQLLQGAVRPEAAVKILDRTLSGLTDAVSYTLLVLFTMVFMLFEVTGLPGKLRAALGDPEADLGRFEKVTTEIKNYIVIKTYVSLATGLLVWVLLAALDVDFALLWGVLAFLFNYIPTFGSIVAAVPPVLLALVQHGVAVSAMVAGGFVGINLVIGNVVEPQLMGRRLGLSTLVVFLSLFFWGWLWGVPGMLLSVPLTMTVKIALENDESWHWIAALMDSAPSPAPRRLPPTSSGAPRAVAQPAAPSTSPATDQVQEQLVSPADEQRRATDNADNDAG